MISDWAKLSGESKSILVPLKKSHVQSFKDYTKCVVGPGDLHIIIHRRVQKLSILRPTLYKQSAERLGVQFEATVRKRQFSSKQSSKPRLEKDRQKRQTLRKRLCESCWPDQNQEMEIETLQIQIILSTKPKKQTSE